MCIRDSIPPSPTTNRLQRRPLCRLHRVNVYMQSLSRNNVPDQLSIATSSRTHLADSKTTADARFSEPVDLSRFRFLELSIRLVCLKRPCGGSSRDCEVQGGIGPSAAWEVMHQRAGCFCLSHGGHFLDTCLLANVWNSVASYGLQSQVQDRE